MVEKQEEHDIKFKNIQLMKDQSLGTGAYGAVYKAKCDDLICAAKVLHPTLFDPSARLQIGSNICHRLPIARFNAECKFLSAINHPNIVQYLDMYEDPIMNLPVLLMELMDESLTSLLERSPKNSICYHIQVNVSRDITLALSFLHSNKIIHRDLSSNNVLLIGNVRAKVADFGMARLGLNPLGTGISNTACPGISVYMPPEAIEEKPVYSEKIDCFSFGVIVLQILTQEFPKPSDRQKVIFTDDPRFPRGLKADVSEVERRQNHISQVDANHPLLTIACECLRDIDSERPSAKQLCEKLAALRESPTYSESVQSSNTEREIKLREQHAQEVQSLRQAFQSQLTEQSEKISVKEQEIQQLKQQLQQVKKELKAGEDRQMHSIEGVSADVKRLNSEQGNRKYYQPKLVGKEEWTENITFTWKNLKEAPCKMERESNAVVNGSIVYVQCSDQEIHSYNAVNNSWSLIQSCPNLYCAIVVVNGLLTTVGGMSGGDYSKILYSLSQEGQSTGIWMEKFPSMPTKRSQSTAFCAQGYLIVAGGQGGRVLTTGVLSTVEVMDVKNRQWFCAADLPEPMYCASGAVCVDRVYLLGGNDKDSKPTKAVFTCSLKALCESFALSLRRQFMRMLSSPNVWSRTIFDVPVTRATGVSFCNQLLAVGGSEKNRYSKDEPTTTIHRFNPSTDSWEVVGHMNMGRCSCFVAVLPNNRLMVVGSSITSSTVDAKTAELATLSY